MGDATQCHASYCEPALGLPFQTLTLHNIFYVLSYPDDISSSHLEFYCVKTLLNDNEQTFPCISGVKLNAETSNSESENKI